MHVPASFVAEGGTLSFPLFFSVSKLVTTKIKVTCKVKISFAITIACTKSWTSAIAKILERDPDSAGNATDSGDTNSEISEERSDAGTQSRRVVFNYFNHQHKSHFREFYRHYPACDTIGHKETYR